MKISALATSMFLVAAGAAVLPQAGGEQKAPVPVPQQPEFDKSTPEKHGRAIADYADLFDSGWKDEVLQGRMTLFDAGGDSVKRRFSRMVYERAKEGDKLIIRFLAPAEIKGVSALTFENPGSSDDNWLYLPSTKRVRRISGSNNTASFQGTEFTYEDLANLDPSEYEWRLFGEEELKRDGEITPVYRLEARPTYKDTGYQRLTVYLHRERWTQERIEYYDRSGTLLKTRESSDWRHFHDRFWRAGTVGIENHQTKKRTVLVTEKQFLDVARYKSAKTGKWRSHLPESLFTTRALEK